MFKDIHWTILLGHESFATATSLTPISPESTSFEVCSFVRAAEGTGDRAASRNKECHTKTSAKEAG